MLFFREIQLLEGSISAQEWKLILNVPNKLILGNMMLKYKPLH